MLRAIVLRAAGTNCDGEMLRGFSRAGASAELVHLERALAEPAVLDGADLIGFPGGFSFGDDVASGRIFAMHARRGLGAALRRAVERGTLILGACNGFQVLVQIGLLPGPRAGEPWPAEGLPARRLALAENAQGRFVDRWVGVEPEPASVCLWTRGLEGDGDVMMLPVAHGEGRLVAEGPGTLAELARSGQVPLRYGQDINGSADRIAGVCDATGRIFGLMPHPERYLDWSRHPFATRLSPAARRGTPPGLQMFLNAVWAAREARGPRPGAMVTVP